MKPTKKFIIIFLSFISILIHDQYSIDHGLADTKPIVICTDWTQVNDNAFGLGTGLDASYSSEESFEVIVYNDQLYLGMEADNSFGARLWRTKAGVQMPTGQGDWEEVIADPEGNPFGISDPIQNDHIDSLAGFNGYLYASTANRSGYLLGINVFRSASGNPGTWENALDSHTAGFDDVNNENFKDMQVFMGHLCGGTANSKTGAQVWCTHDGTTWQKMSYAGFGNGTDEPNSDVIWSGHVYNDELYFGVQNRGPDLEAITDDIGILYRARSLYDLDNNGMPIWEEVYRGPAGSKRINILENIGEYLYISAQSNDGIVILRSSSGDTGSWLSVSNPGMNNNDNNRDTVVDGAIVLNGALYLAVSNKIEGLEIWRTIGILKNDINIVDWELISEQGIGDQNNVLAQLTSFNGYLYAWTSNYSTGQQVIRSRCPRVRFVIVLIGDGMGANHIEAARKYISEDLAFQDWQHFWMATFPSSGSYDPEQAWANFNYVTTGTTDSAAAATAMFTGVKTSNGRISVSTDEQTRLYSIADKAGDLGKAVGIVTSVYASHATPGAWYAHNSDRGNGFAIADEGLWGDPNTTGDMEVDIRYNGGFGSSLYSLDVVIGSGHPNWNGGNYINPAILQKLIDENSASGKFVFIEQIAGRTDGGERLIQKAQEPEVTRLAALYGGSDGHIDYRLADGTGANTETATLEEMTTAALEVLNRDPNGFILLIEGGAIDWASHVNNMDQMIGEMIDFNNAVQVVADWVDSSDNASTWENTLVLVTGDHETGYLAAHPDEFPNVPIGIVNDGTLILEKPVAYSGGLRASWEDLDNDNLIDLNETVHWIWNSNNHSNSLIPLFVKGSGANLFENYQTGTDPIRGTYIDNIDIFKVVNAVILRTDTPTDTSISFFPLLFNFVP